MINDILQNSWEIHPDAFGHYRLQRVGVSGGVFFRPDDIDDLMEILNAFQEKQQSGN